MIKNLIGKIKRFVRRFVKPIRGLGFPGDGRQKRRSEQVEILRRLGVNEFFVNNFPELLSCNESRLGIADKIDVSGDVEKYFAITKEWMNYPVAVPDLRDWRDTRGHDWQNPHPAIKHVLEICRELHPTSILDVGAGAGVVSKYLFAHLGESAKLTCLEGSDSHIAAMKENFHSSDVIPPKLEVRAEIIKGFAQKMPFSNNNFEMIFTCTVMMHNPFIPAVLAACEMARVSSKYILHVEGYHTDGIASLRSKYNLRVPDYERLYGRLGFRMVKKFFYQDPYAKDYDYIVFLAEKVHPVK